MQQKKVNLFFLLPLFIFFLFGCSCNLDKSNAQKEIRKYKNYPSGSFFELPNNSHSHVILINKKYGKSRVLEQTRFYVFNKKDDEIILEDFIPLGKVEWKSDSIVRVEIHPGNIKRNEQQVHGYLFNIKTKEKSKIN